MCFYAQYHSLNKQGTEKRNGTAFFCKVVKRGKKYKPAADAGKLENPY